MRTFSSIELAQATLSDSRNELAAKFVINMCSFMGDHELIKGADLEGFATEYRKFKGEKEEKKEDA